MSDIQTIKDKVDIVQLISEYVPLKKAGINWKACCPFHSEKSPSFMVNAERQYWHCFGCQKGGDIFSFVQEMEGLDFPETLKILASRAGVELATFKQDIDRGKKNRLYEVNSKAAYFYHQFLKTMAPAAIARDYLKNRGVSDNSIDIWTVGFVPDQWDLLTKYLLKNNFTIDDILAAGLCIKNEQRNSYYDVFRGRIMFPISDIYGNITGFTGRILVENEHSGGKYVNTSQTPVFDKSRAVYGLDKAKMDIKSKDNVILVEGQMDVIANHNAGFKNVVAASGTALTDQHLRLLKRYTNNILFAFDADEAGLKAAKRGIDLALTSGMNVRIITLPEGAGKDADECIKKSPDIWKKAVEDAQNVMSWYFQIVFDKYNSEKPDERQKISDELLLEIDKIQYPVEKDAWLKKLADRLGIDPSVLKENLLKMKKSIRVQPTTWRSGEEKPQVEKVEVPLGRLPRLTQNLWSILVQNPSWFTRYFDSLNEQFFVLTEFAPLYEFFKNSYNNKEEIRLVGLDDVLNEKVNLLTMFVDKEYANIKDKELEKEFEFLLNEIKKEWIKTQKDRLFFDLKRAQEAGDKQKEDEILNLVTQLNTI